MSKENKEENEKEENKDNNQENKKEENMSMENIFGLIINIL